MKVFTIFFILLLTSTIYGQNSENCVINPTINSNSGCSIRLNQLKNNEITKYKEYCSNLKSYNLTEYTYIDKDDLTEANLIQSYPLNFKKTKTGFEFKNGQGEILKVQKVDSDSDSKQYQNYDFIARVNNFIIISQTGYESWNYILINLNNFNFYYLPGEPVFINANLIYGYTNYYGSGELTIIDIERKNDVTLSFENEIINIEYSNNRSLGILLEFRNEDCNSTQFLNIVLQ